MVKKNVQKINVDTETGQELKEFEIVPPEEMFRKLYIDESFSSKFFTAKQKVYMMLVVNEKGGNVHANSFLKEEIAKKIGTTIGTINTYISRLKDDGLITSLGGNNGLYRINSYFLTNKKWAEIYAKKREEETGDKYIADFKKIWKV